MLTSPQRAAAALLLMSGLWMACSTATIHRRGGDAVEGIITSSDATSITVEPAAPDPDVTTTPNDVSETTETPSKVVIPRDDIVRIQHPGTITTVAGVVILAAGTTVALLPVFLDDTGYDPVIVIAGVLVAGGGIYVMIDALLTRQASYDAAKSPTAGEAWLAPVPMYDGWGVGMGVVF